MSKYVITLGQIKGGVAKTTSVINIAAALAEYGKKVLLIDLDPQGCLSASFGIFPEEHGKDISRVLFENVPLDQAVRKTDIESIEIIPSNRKMAKEELTINLLDSQKTRRFPLKELIDKIPSDEYDFIILDCPPVLGSITLNALVASNLVIIPSTLDSFSLVGVKKMIDYVLEIKRDYNPKLRYSILLTMFEDHKKFYSSLAEKIREIYANTDNLFNTTISKDINIAKSQLLEQPVLAFRAKSKASDQYRALGMEIINYGSHK